MVQFSPFELVQFLTVDDNASVTRTAAERMPERLEDREAVPERLILETVTIDIQAVKHDVGQVAGARLLARPQPLLNRREAGRPVCLERDDFPIQPRRHHG